MVASIKLKWVSHIAPQYTPLNISSIPNGPLPPTSLMDPNGGYGSSSKKTKKDSYDTYQYCSAFHKVKLTAFYGHNCLCIISHAAGVDKVSTKHTL